MIMLRDRKWVPGYTSDDGSLAEQFYIPALMDAVAYSRGTGYFTADSLARNVRGIEGLIQNKGKMRLLVGCTLDEKEVDAIRQGEDMKKMVERNLCKIPWDIPDSDTKDGLELLSWMVAAGHMEIKVAVRCNDKYEPVANVIYHKKVGIVRDIAGDKIAWEGSDNETSGGQSGNSESLSVFTSWNESGHQQRTEAEFEKDWSGRKNRLVVMDVPEAVRQRLLQYAPPKGRLPDRIKRQEITDAQRNDVWSFINQAHKVKNGHMVGLATAPVKPWPHQVQVFCRLHSRRPIRLLIADEVGLGKTIQAGLFIRQAHLEGRRQILVMAPAGLTRQWQSELREKLNLYLPIYDGKNLTWQDTHAKGDNIKISPDDWTSHGPVIVSSHLARRREHASTITAIKWDMVVLDEAHYARQTNPNNPKKHTPNRMLSMMRRLQNMTKDLILLTATPMQLHPVELYDLLALLGMPQEWTWDNFERFYGCVHNLDAEDVKFVRAMFKAATNRYGPIQREKLNVSPLLGNKILRILDDNIDKRLHTADFAAMKRAMLLCSPVTHLISRNTRKQLREHIKKNNLDWKLGERSVRDVFVMMSFDEREAYKGVEEYISQIWNTYKGNNRQAVGFALTIYRKRLASSFAALKKTLENHLKRLDEDVISSMPHVDEYDEMDSEDIIQEEEKALKEIDREAVCSLLDMIRDLPTDTKFNDLTRTITELQGSYRQVMIFTQFTDTMDFLREELYRRGHKVLCYSGRGGEKPDSHGRWQRIKTREDTKKEFQSGVADTMICTDAAAEGLNFQFCGAMINYDMPWNPMRVEQRIGRIDRIGQEYDTIRIVNLFYKDTVETDVYQVLRKRIDMFNGIVGTLQPILSRLEKRIQDMVLKHPQPPRDLSEIDVDLDKASDGLDDMLATDMDAYEQPESPVTMEDLDRIAANDNIMRPYKVKPLDRQEYAITLSDGKRIRITTDRARFEKHGDSVEFWSPGSPAFPEGESSHIPKHKTLKQLLASMESKFIRGR